MDVRKENANIPRKIICSYFKVDEEISIKCFEHRCVRHMLCFQEPCLAKCSVKRSRPWASPPLMLSQAPNDRTDDSQAGGGTQQMSADAMGVVLTISVRSV